MPTNRRANDAQQPELYEIRVRGPLGPTLLGAFPTLTAQRHGEDTVLRGILPDQSALYGVLYQIESLGLELLEVRSLRATATRARGKSHERVTTTHQVSPEAPSHLTSRPKTRTKQRRPLMSTQTPDSLGVPDVEQTRWRIDPDRSDVEFHSRKVWGLVTVKGRFARYEGTMDLSAQPAIEMTIDADSLDTKNPIRDKHLRSGDYFDVEHHPQVRFVSDSVTLDGERLKVHGRLSAAGHSIPLDAEGTLRFTEGAAEVEVTALADHTQLGMTFSGLGMLRPTSKLIVHGQLAPAVALVGSH
jgi:polyisoprenoid-binding protein YceI